MRLPFKIPYSCLPLQTVVNFFRYEGLGGTFVDGDTDYVFAPLSSHSSDRHWGRGKEDEWRKI